MAWQLEITDTPANVKTQIIGYAGNVPPAEQAWYSSIVTALVAQLSTAAYSSLPSVRLSARGWFDGNATRVSIVLDSAGVDTGKNPLELY
jgi:hypothetical protein